MTMQLRFWGVRGTIPSPGPDTFIIGANTPCIDIRTSDNQTIILDAGTGIRQLGKVLTKEYPSQVSATILISHTHWDHIQGLPFFAPLDSRGNRFIIVGQKRVNQQLEQILAGQISEPYLPFAYKTLAADIHVKEIEPSALMVVGDNTTVKAMPLEHPGGSLGFRIENSGSVIAYCTDTSHPDGSLLPAVLELAQDADLLIHEATFSQAQRKRYPTWGHSSWLEAANVARAANVKSLALFHYSPEDSDDYLMQTVLPKVKQTFPSAILAREGLKLYI